MSNYDDVKFLCVLLFIYLSDSLFYWVIENGCVWKVDRIVVMLKGLRIVERLNINKICI